MIANKTFVSPNIKFGKGLINYIPQILIDNGLGKNPIYFIDIFFLDKTNILQSFLTGPIHFDFACAYSVVVWQEPYCSSGPGITAT